ncbi:hypothetical protein RHSIM_Rhsim09G0214000 [Rhododendron simsii]|uniref:Methyltransferase type 11 domain-containing protein n=1 Tax=Rhododendron simsii TaxID=118357 RepID=A0A834GGH1_RHOSS|nr:hypothetical protein RHSIM_Rhsim09G0214000 [Rhododendron simsii]
MNGCCSTWGAHHFGLTRRPSSLPGRTLPRGGGGEIAQGPPAVGARSTLSSATTTTTIASTTRSTAAGYTSNTEEVEKLQKGIAELYDESSRVWEEIWGDHMHHGFYDPNYNTNKNDNNDALSLLSDHRSAQIRMIEESLRFAGVSEDPMKRPNSVVDVGCGIGGSSRYIARKYEAQCQGITLSPVQAQRAQALAAAEGLANKVSFLVADALNQPFPDAQFDLVWSMESGEHMPDKAKFVNELARVAAPGATIILVTWCHRDLSPSEKSLRQEEEDLLRKICDAYYLPAWCSTGDYVKLLESLSLQVLTSSIYDLIGYKGSRLVGECCPILACSNKVSIDMEGLHIIAAKWMENHKRGIGDAIDDPRIQDGANQVCYHYMSEACVVTTNMMDVERRGGREYYPPYFCNIFSLESLRWYVIVYKQQVWF